MSQTKSSSSSSISVDHSNNKTHPKQLEHLSPLAVGDQKLTRHLGYFSGTLMNGKIGARVSILELYSHCYV